MTEVHGLNIVSVSPENHQKVVDALRSLGPRAEIPGLLSFDLLRSPDGGKLVSHMRWESMSAFENASSLPRVVSAITEITRLTEDDGNPGFYELLYSHD